MNRHDVMFTVLGVGLVASSVGALTLSKEVETLKTESKQTHEALVLELGEVRGISERLRYAHNKLWPLQSTFNQQIVAVFQKLGILSSTEFTLRGKVEVDQE